MAFDFLKLGASDVVVMELGIDRNQGTLLGLVTDWLQERTIRTGTCSLLGFGKEMPDLIEREAVAAMETEIAHEG